MKSSDYFILNTKKKSFRFFNSLFLFNSDEYCKALNSYINNNKSSLKREKEKLIKHIDLFMKSHNFVFTNKQKIMYDTLCNKEECYLIMFPYQPNLFPSVSAIAPAVHMETIRIIMEKEYNTTIVPIFLVVDYDNAQDKRFSKAFFPYLASSTSKLHFNYKIEKAQKYDTMFSIAIPTKNVIDIWKQNIERCVNNLLQAFPKTEIEFTTKLQTNKNEIDELLDKAKENEHSFSGFNTYVLYHILVKKWDCGMFFIEGHNLYLSDTFFSTKIHSNKDKMYHKFNEIHFLLQQKDIQTSFKELSRDSVFFWYYRKKCCTRCKCDVECFENCLPDYIFPDVISDYILDYILIGKVGSVGYFKQFEATVYSEYILGELFGIEGSPQLLTCCHMDPFYNLEHEKNLVIKFCDKKHIDYNEFFKACNDSHCSILYHLLLQGFDPVLNYLKNI